MESFLDRVEREAALEVQRIRTEAQQIVDVLTALQLEVPQELQHIVSHTPIEEVWEPLPETKSKKQDHSERIAKIKARAEERYQQTRAEIYAVLSKGPKLSEEVFNQIPRSKYGIQQAFNRMRKAGEVDFRTKGFQGQSEWFLTERPVSLEQLRDEVVDRKGGDIPLEELLVRLKSFQKMDHLIAMMDELADQGIIRRTEDGDYENYPSKPTSDLRTFHEKKSYTYVGNGVAGTGRSKLTGDAEVKAYLDKVRAQGAVMKSTGGGHIQIEYNGKTITVAKTPSKSGILQDKNRVKSLGLNV